MKRSIAKSKKNESRQGVRIPHTVSIPVEQDAWLSGLLGEKGNLSAFIQALIDAARTGKLDTEELLKGQKPSDSLARAVAYMKAKEAGMLFEEDVASMLTRSVAKGRGVSRSRIYNGQAPTFIADFSIEDEKGNALCSIVCKSSPRAERIQLALAEAMIGTQRTGRPVIVVVPYLLQGDAEVRVIGQYKALGYMITDLPGLLDAVQTGCK